MGETINPFKVIPAQAGKFRKKLHEAASRERSGHPENKFLRKGHSYR
ncbi:MAG: hypothetical protein ACYCSW_10300 [bacterium]